MMLIALTGDDGKYKALCRIAECVLSLFSSQEISAVPMPDGGLDPTTVPTSVPIGQGVMSLVKSDLSQRTWTLALLSRTPEQLAGAALREVWYEAYLAVMLAKS